MGLIKTIQQMQKFFGLVIINHVSFQSCKIAKEFKVSKTKCRYFIDFGIASVYKTNLTKEINMSPFYSFSFDDGMNCHAAMPNGCSD